VSGACECGNELLCSINCGEILEKLLASQEGLCCTKLVGWLAGWLVSLLS